MTWYDEAVGLAIQGEGAAAALPVQVQRVPLAVVNPDQSEVSTSVRQSQLTNYSHVTSAWPIPVDYLVM